MHFSALAIALAGRRVRRVPPVVINAQRWAIPLALLDHLCDLSIGHLQAMLDGIAAAIERALQAGAVVSMARDLLVPAVRFVDCGPQFLNRERGLRDQI